MKDEEREDQDEAKLVLFQAHFTEEEAKEFDLIAEKNHRTRKRHLEFLVKNWIMQRRGKSYDYTY